MGSRWGTLAAAVTIVAAGAAIAAGEELELKLDPARTEVVFDVEATGHDVHGVVQLESGRIRFDPATGAASGEIVVDAAGAETGNGSRDETLREKVFEIARFPKIRFEVERVAGEVPRAGEGQIVLHGALDLHGDRHPMALPARVRVENGHATAETRFEVPFKEWGLRDPSIAFLRVAGVVTVQVHADGSVAEAPAVAAVGPSGR